jgi:hypothetical protein
MTDGAESQIERLVRIETKLDGLVHTLMAKLDDHEMRLRALERKLWLAAGVALAGGGTLGTVASQIIGA